MSRTGNQFRLQDRHGDQDDTAANNNDGKVVAWQSKKNRRGSGRPQAPVLGRRQVRLALSSMRGTNLAALAEELDN
jgi:hypothetical protein